ncbi:PLP-dependent aminotransferase family protein [Phytoactinopolyspora halophila]|nr:PLP-dependent aminotransferase family protein [Phytoactinopolyspora halophila]
MRAIDGRQLARLLGRTQEADPIGGTGTVYRHLASAIQMLILDGRLAIQTRLPSERELATALATSRTTVTAAYDALRTAGYAASRRGAGTWTTLPDDRPADPVAAFAPSTTSTHIDLAPAAPEAPGPELRAAYEHALTQLPHYMSGHGYHILGLPSLRDAIAARFNARGLPTTPEQIIVTSGAQHAFTLVLAALGRAGDRVIIDHPTYPNALDAIRRIHAEPVPVTLAEDGWDLEALAAAVRQSGPRLAYLLPDFQNPTGLLASDVERRHLAETLARARVVTVVDESNVEVGFVTPPPPLATYAPGVITLGSAGKSFWGGLRIGWIRAEQTMIRRLATTRANLDLASPPVEQEATAHLLRQADEILPHRRADLRERRDAMIALLAEYLPGWRVRPPDGGLALWCDMGMHVSSRLTTAAGQHGLRLAAGPRFGVDGAFERRIRLPLTLPRDVMQPTVQRLAHAFESVAAGGDPVATTNLRELFA